MVEVITNKNRIPTSFDAKLITLQRLLIVITIPMFVGIVSSLVYSQPQPQPPAPVTHNYQPEITIPPSPAQEIDNNVVPKYNVGTLLYFSVSDPTTPITQYITSPSQISWQIVPPSPNFRQVDNNLGAVFTSSEPASFTILVAIATSAPSEPANENKNLKVHLLSKQFTVGKLPTPPPDPQPDPDPTPQPDPPDPNPTPAPIPEPGLRVLIIEEVNNRSSLPRTQLTLLTSTSFRKFLNESCVKANIPNPVPEWRLFDKDSSLDNESSLWKKAFQRFHNTTITPSPTVPWLIVSNGKKGFEGPLPKTEDETITLIKKYVLNQ